MADYRTVAVEHVQHWLLVAFPGFRPVVAVVGVASRGQGAEAPPSAFFGERDDAPYWRFRHHGEVDALGDVLGRAVELVEERGARRARAFRKGQHSRLSGRWAEAVVVRSAGNIML